MAPQSFGQLEEVIGRAAENARLLASVERRAAAALEKAAEMAHDEQTALRRWRAAARAREIASRQDQLVRWFETPPSQRGKPPVTRPPEEPDERPDTPAG